MPRSGQLSVRAIFCPARSASGHAERQAMIDKPHALPVATQCRLLDISRGCVYYRPVPGGARPGTR